MKTYQVPPGMVLSPEQEKLVDWAANGSGNLVIIAGAGCGKTTTSLMMIDNAPESRVAYMAFNKDNVRECAEKIRRKNVVVSTLNAAGFKIVTRAIKGVTLDTGRTLYRTRLTDAFEAYKKSPIADDFLVAQFTPSLINRAYDLLSWHRCVNPLSITKEKILESAYSAAALVDVDLEMLPLLALLVLKVLLQTRQAALNGTLKAIDYGDQIWLPLVCDWVRPTYQYLMVDECQDMDTSQLEMVRRLVNGRAVLIGDPNQAIYGFRGADSEGMERMRQLLKAQTMTLSLTRRCPKLVVGEANNYVKEYFAHPSNPEGEVKTAKVQDLFLGVKKGDMILSRVNAPLMSLCLRLMTQGTPCRIMGRKIGQNLIETLRKMADGDSSSLNMLKRLGEWNARQIEIVNETYKNEDLAEARIAALEDTYAVFESLVEEYPLVGQIENHILNTFHDNADPGSCVVLSTIHRAKGKEGSRVWILEDTFKKKTEGEESRLRYVAVTRSMGSLFYVQGPLTASS